MRFEFATADRIIFGLGAATELPGIVASYGCHAFVMTGAGTNRSETLIDVIRNACTAIFRFEVHGEPTVAVVQQAVRVARDNRCDVVVGIGGGSVLDSAKAVAAMLTNPGEIEDYLEIVGAGKSIAIPSAPCIAVPTTAGTGSEVTRNSVLGVPDRKVKVSMRSPLMLPRVALIDPQLTVSLPPEITASTGMDAMTQLLEAFVCKRANPMTDAVCREGLHRCGRSMMRACRNPRDLFAREDLSLAALFSGIALANAGLGAVHGLAGPLGGTIHAPHGVICARLLPFVCRANIHALGEQSGAGAVLTRYDQAAGMLMGDPDARCDALIDWFGELCDTLSIPRLSEYGLNESTLSEIIQAAQNASSMKTNPAVLSNDVLMNILRQSL